MADKIGIITAENSLKYIQEAVAEKEDSRWEIEFLPYTADRHLPELYTGNLHRFSGLVFSGRFNHDYIELYTGKIWKPHVVFELTDRDYYKAFARLLYRYPGTDIRRVLMEVPTSQDVDLQELFDGACPTWFDVDFRQAESLTAAYDMALEYAQRLWREKKIDRVMTRLTNAVDPLLEMGIPTEPLFPSKVSIQERLQHLYGQLQSQQLTNTRTVFGIVCCAPNTSCSMDTLQNLLEEFNSQLGMPLIIRREKDCFELATSNETLIDITQQYTNCLLSLFLHERMPQSPVCVGWGIGQDITSANKNAATALAEARRSNGRRAYLVNESREVIGPLATGRSISVESLLSPQAEEIGKALGISPRNIQKLINLQEKRGVRFLSSGDLAYYLNVTPRSANRILAKLVQHGGAQVAHSTQSLTRGRPSYVYEVDWRRLLPAGS